MEVCADQLNTTRIFAAPLGLFERSSIDGKTWQHEGEYVERGGTVNVTRPRDTQQKTSNTENLNFRCGAMQTKTLREGLSD